MDMVSLSSEAAILIAPYLPKLILEGKFLAGKALEEFGKEAGGSAWKKAVDIWEKVNPFADTTMGRAKLSEIAEEPEIPKRTEELRKFLTTLMNEHPTAQTQIAKVIQNFTNSSNFTINIS